MSGDPTEGESERTVTAVEDAPPSTVMLRVPSHRMITQETSLATPLGRIAASMVAGDGIETTQMDM